MKIGFIGLGTMGSGVCRNLIRHGHTLYVYDVKQENRLAFEKEAQVTSSALAAFEASEITFLSLPGSPQVESVCADFLKADVAGKTVIDISTSYPLSTRKLAALFEEKGGSFIDSPLAGSPAQAASGNMIIYVGGKEEDVDRLMPIFKCYADTVRVVGGSGCGNIIKLVNNYFAILYGNLYAELFTAANKFGMDPQFIYDVIGLTGVNCTPYQVAGKKIVTKSYEKAFGLNLAYKDLTYMKKLFVDIGAPCHMLDAGLTMYEEARVLGLGDEDLSAVAKVMDHYLAQRG